MRSCAAQGDEKKADDDPDREKPCKATLVLALEDVAVAVRRRCAGAEPASAPGERAELSAQADEVGDLALELTFAPLDRLAHELAGWLAPIPQSEHLPDLAEGEPRSAGAGDEAETAFVVRVIEPVAGGGAASRVKEPDALVVADRLRVQVETTGQLADAKLDTAHARTVAA